MRIITSLVKNTRDKTDTSKTRGTGSHPSPAELLSLENLMKVPDRRDNQIDFSGRRLCQNLKDNFILNCF